MFVLLTYQSTFLYFPSKINYFKFSNRKNRDKDKSSLLRVIRRWYCEISQESLHLRMRGADSEGYKYSSLPVDE